MQISAARLQGKHFKPMQQHYSLHQCSCHSAKTAVSSSCSSKRSQVLEDEAEAVTSLHGDRWPLAHPAKLKQVLQQLHLVQQDMMFHANMSEGVQMAATASRSFPRFPVKPEDLRKKMVFNV